VRRQAGIKFQCPACAAEGHDEHRDNAILFLDGTWGCAWAKDTENSRAHWDAIGYQLGALNGRPSKASTANTIYLGGSPKPSPAVAGVLQVPNEGMIGVGHTFAALYAHRELDRLTKTRAAVEAQ
jgi:hypothetical protein